MKYTSNNRKTGALYEQRAGAYLEEQGYQILEYNYRCPLGEVDIVAKEQGYLIFCEVKYRKTVRKGTPQEAVTIKKQKTISKCAQYYLMKKGTDSLAVRFDVVAISGSQEEKEEILLIKNAFDFVR